MKPAGISNFVNSKIIQHFGSWGKFTGSGGNGRSVLPVPARSRQLTFVGATYQSFSYLTMQADLMKAAATQEIGLLLEGVPRNPIREAWYSRGFTGLDKPGFLFGLDSELIEGLALTLSGLECFSNDVSAGGRPAVKERFMVELTQNPILGKTWVERLATGNFGELPLVQQINELRDQIHPLRPLDIVRLARKMPTWGSNSLWRIIYSAISEGLMEKIGETEEPLTLEEINQTARTAAMSKNISEILKIIPADREVIALVYPDRTATLAAEFSTRP